MTANATGAQPIRPSYQASMLGFHAKLEILLRGQLQDEVAVTKTGGQIGAGELLIPTARVFSGLVPWLYLLVKALFTTGPSLARRNAGLCHPAWRLPGIMRMAI